MSDQPELELHLNAVTHREWRGEGEHAKAQAKPDDGSVTWKRVRTLERCHVCIEQQASHFDGADGSPHVAWPASYVRTEAGERIALCYEHAAPRRAAEGLQPQRSRKP